MQLYWQNAVADGLWDTVLNWFEDADALIPHGALPASGDSVQYATGESTPIEVSAVAIDIGAGVATGLTLTIDGGGSISSGHFSTCTIANAGGIADGTFTGGSFSNSAGTVNGGTFNCSFNNSGGSVNGGAFYGSFSGPGGISGGTFFPSGTIAFTSAITGGHLVYGALGTAQADPGFAANFGIYAPVITVTGIPIATDILGAGLL